MRPVLLATARLGLLATALVGAAVDTAGQSHEPAAKAVPDHTVAGVIPPLVVSIAIGMTTATAASVLVGLPVMRLRGVYLAIATLGFGEMVKITLNNMSWTGGALGMRVDKLVTLPIAFAAVGLDAYWFARQRPSRLRRALAAIREDVGDRDYDIVIEGNGSEHSPAAWAGVGATWWIESMWGAVNEADAALAPKIEALGMEVSVLRTVMRDDDDRARLAKALLELGEGMLRG